MRRVLRGLSVVLVGALLAVGAWWFFTQRPQVAGPAVAASNIVDEAVVQVQDLDVTVSASGTVSPSREAQLSFAASAPVQMVVAEGTLVQQGDVLARLDAADLEASLRESEIALALQQLAYDALVAVPRDEDIAVAQAAVSAARASVGAAVQSGTTTNQVEIARLQAELARNQLWQAQLNRDLQLSVGPEFRGGDTTPQQDVNLQAGVSQAEVGVAIADSSFQATAATGANASALASANAQLVQAQVALDRLLNGPSDIDVRLAEISLEQVALSLAQTRNSLAQTVLLAPFTGVVARVNLTLGELPPSSSAAMVLIDLSSLYVNLLIDENDVVNILPDQTVSLRIDALPESRVTGRVERIDLTPTRVGEAVTYQARVVINPTLEPVRLGMTVTATIVTQRRESVLTLANRFIRIDRGTQQAFVTVQRADGRFDEVPIVLGARNNDVSEVVDGLDAGQRVVLRQRGVLDIIGG